MMGSLDTSLPFHSGLHYFAWGTHCSLKKYPLTWSSFGNAPVRSLLVCQYLTTRKGGVVLGEGMSVKLPDFNNNYKIAK